VQTYDLDYHLQQTLEPLRTAFLTLRDKVLALDGVEERVNRKSQITYRTTKSFLACGFGKRRITVQFKGGAEPPNVPGVEIKDIRSRQWGYPCICNFKEPGEVDSMFEIVLSAYAYEQQRDSPKDIAQAAGMTHTVGFGYRFTEVRMPRGGPGDPRMSRVS